MDIKIEENAWSLSRGVVVSKETLLEKLTENKKKHDELYAAAVEEFQFNVGEYGKKLVEYNLALSKNSKVDGVIKSRYYEKVAESIKSVYLDNDCSSIPEYKLPPQPVHSKTPEAPPVPSKPVSYEHEYLAAIQKIKVSSHDLFNLSENEFNSYILNDWSWKKKFLESTFYSPNYYNSTGSLRGVFGSGLAVNF